MRLMRFAAAAAVTAAFAIPAAGAFAQTTTSYYIVQNVKTRHCSVVAQRPAESTMTVVGPNGVMYRTRTQALDAMKTVKVCQ